LSHGHLVSQLITLTNIPESQLVTRSPHHIVSSSP